MNAPGPEQQLEIARRVHETFSTPHRWHRGTWGHDARGRHFSFDRGFHADWYHERHEPDLTPATPDSPLCFCLGAAIRIHTGLVLHGDPGAARDEDFETVSAVYTALADIDAGDPEDFRPHLNSLIDWNDVPGRTFEDIRNLTAAVLRRLDARRW